MQKKIGEVDTVKVPRDEHLLSCKDEVQKNKV